MGRGRGLDRNSYCLFVCLFVCFFLGGGIKVFKTFSRHYPFCVLSELSSGRDYEITHSVRSMYVRSMYVICMCYLQK